MPESPKPETAWSNQSGEHRPDCGCFPVFLAVLSFCLVRIETALANWQRKCRWLEHQRSLLSELRRWSGQLQDHSSKVSSPLPSRRMGVASWYFNQLLCLKIVAVTTSLVARIKQVQVNFPPSHCQMREAIILVERKILSEKRTSAENRSSHDLLGTTSTSEPATIPTNNALALGLLGKCAFFFGATCKTTLNNAFPAQTQSTR